MSVICTCNAQVKHLNIPNCMGLPGIIKRVILVPTYKQDGTLNYIDTTGTLNAADFWNGLQYNTESSERFFPIPVDFENVELPKEDTVYQTFNSGRKIKVRDGVRSFRGFLPEIAAVYVGKIESKHCADHSVYFVDNNGNLIGVEKTKGMLYPMQIANNSIDSMFVFATDATVPGINVMFEFAHSVLDSQISYLPASEIVIDLFTQFDGKYDSNIVQVGTGTTTSFVVDIYTDFGDVMDKDPVEGLVAADLTLYNVTDSASVTISTLTESALVPGRYTLTFTAQTATDILRLGLSTSDAAKPYDGILWADVQITLQ